VGASPKRISRAPHVAMWAYRLTYNVDHSYQLPVLIDLADWWSIPSHQSIRSPFGDLHRNLDRTGTGRGMDLGAGESDKRVDAGSLLKSRDAIKYRARAALPTLVDGLKKPLMVTMLPLVSIRRLFIPAVPDSAVATLSAAAKRRIQRATGIEPRQAKPHRMRPTNPPCGKRNSTNCPDNSSGSP
jgi:hypothetical protein